MGFTSNFYPSSVGSPAPPSHFVLLLNFRVINMIYLVDMWSLRVKVVRLPLKCKDFPSQNRHTWLHRTLFPHSRFPQSCTFPSWCVFYVGTELLNVWRILFWTMGWLSWSSLRGSLKVICCWRKDLCFDHRSPNFQISYFSDRKHTLHRDRIVLFSVKLYYRSPNRMPLMAIFAKFTSIYVPSSNRMKFGSSLYP